jgi:hypothetical protein
MRFSLAFVNQSHTMIDLWGYIPVRDTDWRKTELFTSLPTPTDIPRYEKLTDDQIDED